MANKDLLLTPQKIKGGKDEFWWYEEAKGISVIVPCKGETKMVLIPWSRIRASLKRKDRSDGDVVRDNTFKCIQCEHVFDLDWLQQEADYDMKNWVCKRCFNQKAESAPRPKGPGSPHMKIGALNPYTGNVKYASEHDAWFDADTGEWAENICGDTDCLLCKNRPVRWHADAPKKDLEFTMFVLEPRGVSQRAAASREAMHRYADAIRNSDPDLANSLAAWVNKEQFAAKKTQDQIEVIADHAVEVHDQVATELRAKGAESAPQGEKPNAKS